ncbi:MAG: hypothetical protein AB8F78_14250 [Saprospiraceae bacterium]
MKILLCLCLATLSFSSLAQDFQAYYQGTNQAKTAIIQDSLNKALSAYKATFDAFDFGFARDCYNALEVSVKHNDDQLTDYFVRRCILQGITYETLFEDPKLLLFRQTKNWSEVTIDKDSLREIYLHKIDWEIREEVNQMFAEDQVIRDLAHKNRFNIFKRKQLEKRFREVDSRLVQRLLVITKQYGFPGEQLIGIDESSMHSKINTRRFTAGMPIVILIHHFSQPNESYDSLLIREVRGGYLYNEHFAIISDFQHTYGLKKEDPTASYSETFDTKVSTTQINENRKKVYLLPYEHYQQLSRTKLITPFWRHLY